MATTLLPFDHPGEPPDLGQLCGLLGLPPGVLDEPFGVLPVCEQEGRYAVLVDSQLLEPVRSALARLAAAGVPALRPREGIQST